MPLLRCDVCGKEYTEFGSPDGFWNIELTGKRIRGRIFASICPECPKSLRKHEDLEIRRFFRHLFDYYYEEKEEKRGGTS